LIYNSYITNSDEYGLGMRILLKAMYALSVGCYVSACFNYPHLQVKRR